MNQQKKFLFSLYFVAGLLSLFSVYAVAGEIVLPSVVMNMDGLKSSAPFHRTLNEFNIPILLHNFKPEQVGWEWEQKAIHYHADTREVGETSFEFGFKKVDESSGGVWGSISSVMRSTVNHLMLHGKLVGELVRTEINCPEPFDRLGYHLNIDLGKSDYLVQAFLTHVSIQICVQKSKAELTMSFTPGVGFQGLKDPYTESFLMAQQKAWVNALRLSAQFHQAE